MKNLIIILTIALAGCATPQPPMYYTRTSSTPAGADLELARAKCEYESTASTQSTDYGYRSMFGQELDRAMRKGKLMEMCMKAQGFVLHI